jgi:DNA polymerase III subunit gamma/tau
MSYVVLARKYRPKNFNDVVGQEHVTQTLVNGMLAGRISHAYLFSGPRGVGKTTAARILARSLNCINGPTDKPCEKCNACIEILEGSAMDVVEIDGASNRGIDEIRSLRDNVKFASVNLKYKVYIIDEVHMLTEQAFNALLKTLEEPPAHVVFIFATTELHKIPETILSRCQKFNFKLVAVPKIINHLKNILDQEKIEYDPEALELVAKASQGSIRDALSLLDQVISYSPKKVGQIETQFILGVVNQETLFKITDSIIQSNSFELLNILNNIFNEGYDSEQIMKDLREHYRTLMLVKIDPKMEDVLNVTIENLKQFKEQSSKITLGKILRDLKILSSSINEMKWSDYPKLVFEICLVKLSKPYVSPDELIKKLEQMNISNSSLDMGESDIKNSESTNTSQNISSAAPSKKIITEEVVEKIEKIEENKTSETPEKEINSNYVDRDVRTNWVQALHIAKEEKIYFGSYLSDNQEIKIENNKITIYVKSKFVLDGIMKNKSVLEKAIKKIFGSDIYFSCEVKENMVLDEESSKSITQDYIENLGTENNLIKESKSNTYSPDEIVEAEPIVEKVLDMFDGEIMPRR